VMKGGLKSEKREDAEVMEDIHKMKEEMDGEGSARPHHHPTTPLHTRGDDDEEEEELEGDDGNVTDHEAAADGEGQGGESDCRAWKRARRELHCQSPSSPPSSPPFGGERPREEDGTGSDFDVSAPSSPHGDDGGVHHTFDSFSAMKPLTHPDAAHFDDPLCEKVDSIGVEQSNGVKDVAELQTLLST